PLSIVTLAPNRRVMARQITRRMSFVRVSSPSAKPLRELNKESSGCVLRRNSVSPSSNEGSGSTERQPCTACTVRRPASDMGASFLLHHTLRHCSAHGFDRLRGHLGVHWQ